MSTHFSIYSNSTENREYLRQTIEASGTGQLVETRDLAHLPTQAVNGTDVIFLEYQEDNPELDHWIETTARNPENPAIFLYFKEISTHKLWKALRLGAKECFTFPIQAEDFHQAVQRLQAWTEVRQCLGKPTKILAFLGCKGGVGTSFLVANIASLLAQERRGKVLAVDLDLGSGQLSHFFDIRPEHTMTEVVENLERLDKIYLQSILSPLGDNGYLLPAPARLEEAELMHASHLERIIRYLKENMGFRWIVLDCCHQFNEIILKALELSEILVLVTAPSIPALANAKKMLEILNILGLSGLEIEIWLNFYDRQNQLTLADVEAFLDKKVMGTITCDYQSANFSINEGKPLVESAPRHSISGDLKRIAGNITRDHSSEGANGSGWKWLPRVWRKK